MERIDVSNLIKVSEEPRGNNTKYWIRDDMDRLIKYNDPTCRDTDVMESISSFILRFLNINAVNVELGFNTDIEALREMKVDDGGCCIIDTFLTEEGDTLYELSRKWSRINTSDEQKNISSCFYKMFNMFTSLRGVTASEVLCLKRDYVRQVFGDCIIGNEDRRLKNIAVIYNERNHAYRLAPSFDNALAFSSFHLSDDEAKCFIGNQNFPASSIIVYIINHHLDYVNDIALKLDELAAYGIDVVCKNYDLEIEPSKLEFISDFIKRTNNQVQTRIIAKDNKKIGH